MARFRRHGLWAIAAVAVLAGVVWTRRAPPLRWHDTLAGALDSASGSARPAVIVVTMPRCAACEELERRTLTHPRVRRALEGFELAHRELAQDETFFMVGAQRVDVAGTPTLVFVGADGIVAPEPRLEGFVSPNTLCEAVKDGRGRLLRRHDHSP